MRGQNQSQNQAKSGLAWVKQFALMLMVSAGLLSVVALVGLARSGEDFLSRVRGKLLPPAPEPKVETRSVVIQQIRAASELTTAVFTMEAVVPTQQDATLGAMVIGTTKLLYIAHGEVRAGVDLTHLTSEQLRVSGNSAQLRLPPPKLLDAKIDVLRSGVYDYNRGFLGLGPDVAPNLQKLAEQTALNKIRQAACQDRLLEKANDRAKQVVSQLAKAAGMTEVVVETQPLISGECPASEPPLSNKNSLGSG